MAGDKKDKKMSRAKKFFFMTAGLAVVGVIAFAGLEITCSSWFCTSCHEMEGLGDNWKYSRHGPSNPKMSNCMKCHAQPGFIGLMKAKINGAFSLVYHLSGNYHLEATQPVVCLQGGCHLLEDLDRANRPHQVVALNHAAHIEVMKKIGTRYQCMPCHRHIAHGKGKYLPDMKADCLRTCHTDRPIVSSNCALCHLTHPDIRLKAEEAFPGEEISLMALHKDPEVSCLECHVGLSKTTQGSCQGCHGGKNYDPLVISQVAE